MSDPSGETVRTLLKDFYDARTPASLALLTCARAFNVLKSRSWTLHAAALAFCLLLLPLGAVTPQIRSTVLALTLVPWQQK